MKKNVNPRWGHSFTGPSAEVRVSVPEFVAATYVLKSTQFISGMEFRTPLAPPPAPSLPAAGDFCVVDSFKVMARHANAHALVHGAFRLNLTPGSHILMKPN